MKTRTIEELHDKYIGNKKFAKICDLLIDKGFKVTDIKEYNEQFKFCVNGYLYIYNKNWKSSAKEFVTYLLNIHDMKQMIGNFIWG